MSYSEKRGILKQTKNSNSNDICYKFKPYKLRLICVLMSVYVTLVNCFITVTVLLILFSGVLHEIAKI